MEKDTILNCPYCGAENSKAARNCAQCGEALIRVCPRCNAINAITAEHCSACGQQLDVLGHIMARNEIRFIDRFTRHAKNVSGVKEQETTQARQRTDLLWEPERRRQ